MEGLPYLDFDVLFGRAGDGYRAQVIRSPAGDGQLTAFARPFSDLELENFLLKIGRPRTRTRRIEIPPVAAAKQAGARLFDSVFTGPVGECLRRSLDRARDAGATLRIRLRLSDCPELADLPWELLYDRSDDWFLALSAGTPVIRYVQLPDQPRAIPVTLPLRILVIRSEATDSPHLDLAQEWAQVAGSLTDLRADGRVTITELAAPTLSELRRALLRDRFNILHYMGHGEFDQQRGGTLLFTDRAGRGVPVSGSDLGVILHDHTSLRLAVLNSCLGGRTDPEDPFAGIADTLVRRGIPAVVAMQFEVSDDAAVEFAPALYGALAAGRPVDAAVAEARKAVYTISPLEWATPVLYMRADDARLFDITGRPSAVPDATPGAVPAALPPAQNWSQLGFAGVHMDTGNNPVVLLKEHNGSRTLPIQVSATEAVSVNLMLRGDGSSLDHSNDWYAWPYDLLYRVLRQSGIQIWSVSIRNLAQGEPNGFLVLSNGLTVNGKAADLIALAIRAGAMIFTSADLLDQAGVAFAEHLESSASPYGILPETTWPACAPSESGRHGAEVIGVRVETATNKPLVLLREKEQPGRYLPVWISPAEATGVASAQQGATMAGPAIYDLFCDVLQAGHIALNAAIIAGARDGVFFGLIAISNGKWVEARAGDSIALALRTHAELTVAVDVLDQLGVTTIDDQPNGTPAA